MLVLMLVLVLMLIAMQAKASDATAKYKKASSKRNAKKVAATCMPEAWLSCACIHVCMPDANMTIVSCTRRMLRTKRTAAVMLIK